MLFPLFDEYFDVDFPEESFDVILSSLAFHYVADYENLIKKIAIPTVW